MNEDKIKSNFQFVDNYVRSSKMKVFNRNIKDSILELGIEVKISDVKREKNMLSAELRLKNLVKICDKDSKRMLIEIEIEMAGIFKGENMEEKKFIEFIKYSGTPIISQAIRSYVMNISAIGGIDTIRLPLINFVEFYKNNKNEM